MLFAKYVCMYKFATATTVYTVCTITMYVWMDDCVFKSSLLVKNKI